MRIGIDMLGMQSPDHRGRGIGRYCTDLLRVLFREASSHRFVLYRHDGLPTDGLPEGTNTSIRTLPRDPGGRTSSEALARIVATNPDGLDSLLILSPFEPSTDYRIPDRPAHGLPLAAVVYDLIPLLHPARYLPNERLRRRYHATTWALRRYDALLTISEWTRIDCLRLLGLPPHQVVTIGTASDPDFFTPEPTRPTPAAAREALLQLGIRPPFVLNGGGCDDRNNIGGLIDGFAGLRRVAAAALPALCRVRLPVAVRGLRPADPRGHALRGAGDRRPELLAAGGRRGGGADLRRVRPLGADAGAGRGARPAVPG